MNKVDRLGKALDKLNNMNADDFRKLMQKSGWRVENGSLDRIDEGDYTGDSGCDISRREGACHSTEDD